MGSPPRSNLLLFQRPAKAAPSETIAVAIRPGSDPWFLLEHALDWADRLDARVDLCSVVPAQAGAFTSTEAPTDPAREGRPRHRRLTGWLQALMETLPVHRRGAATVLEGEPGPALTEFAHRHTMVLVGRARRKGMGALFSRSVPSQLAQRCPVPVAIVRGRRIRRDAVVMLPVSPATPRLEAVEWVAAHLQEGSLRTVRVARGYDGAAISVPAMSAAGDPGRHFEVRVSVRVVCLQSVQYVLSRYTGQLDADLVAVPAAARRAGLLRWLFGTVVDRLVQTSRCSVLVVPRTHEARAERAPGPPLALAHCSEPALPVHRAAEVRRESSGPTAG
jgi:nucleotide-binding universal stress UspA family protein